MKVDKPAKILVKVTVNSDLAAELKQAGYTAYKRTPSQQAAIDARHTEAAETRGVDPLRFAQNVPGGRQVPDSGTPIFGRNGQSRVSLSQVVGDIARELPELKLVGLNLQTKDEHKSVLWMVFEPQNAERLRIQPTGAMLYWYNMLLETTYQFLHVWRNPDGSVTVNAGSPMSGEIKDEKVLRIYEEGRSIRCVPRGA